MLDTNHISYLAKGTSAAARATMLERQSGHDLCISSITEAESLYGLAKKQDARQLKIAVQALIAQVEVLPWRHEEAETYAELRARQEATGKKLEPLDMLIAAHAMATDSILVSADKAFRHFLPADKVENWSTDLN